MLMNKNIHTGAERMENKVIKERLSRLRAAMEKEGIDYYLMPTSDFHNSEYSADFFKVREYFCGFDGSNGTLVVSREEAGMWTDGRYFIQAENQMAGTGVKLYRMLEENVPTIDEDRSLDLTEGFFQPEQERGLKLSSGPKRSLWGLTKTLPMKSGLTDRPFHVTTYMC